MSDKKSKAKSSPAKDEAKAAKPKAEAEEKSPAAEPEEEPSGEAGASAEGGEKKSGWAAGDVEALRAENAELKDRVMRAHAEMENLRRRTDRDKADTAKYAISNFARDVLTIADHIALAIGHVPDDAITKDDELKSFRDGIMVTERELLNVMERHGITRLDPKGERFDPNNHQAMFEVPNPDVPDGTVVEVVQAGYVIADRVLRPAMVGVSKGGPKQPKAEAAPQAANDDSPEGGAPPDEPPAGKGGKADKDIGGKVDKSA